MSDPIPMRLVCEGCGKLHLDEGEFLTKPHHTHSCQHCGLSWRPAVVHTVGVRFLPGFKNSPLSTVDRGLCLKCGCKEADHNRCAPHWKVVAVSASVKGYKICPCFTSDFVPTEIPTEAP